MKSLRYSLLFFSFLSVGFMLQGCPQPCKPKIEYVDRPVYVDVPVSCTVTLPEEPIEANTTAETALNIKQYIILFKESIKSCIKPKEQ